MKNGLYRVIFQTGLGNGSGVITLQDGKLLGGDASMFYVGDYKTNNGAFSATVKVDRHTAIPGIASVLGTNKAVLNLEGTHTETAVSAEGSASQAPGIKFAASLNWIAD